MLLLTLDANEGTVLLTIVGATRGIVGLNLPVQYHGELTADLWVTLGLWYPPKRSTITYSTAQQNPKP